MFDYALLEESGYISCQKEDGDRLSHFSKRHRYTQSDVKQFIAQVSGALAAAHKAGFHTYFLSPETVSVYAHPEGGYFYRVLCVGYEQIMGLGKSLKGRLKLLKKPESLAPEMNNGELLGFKTTQFIFGNMIYKLLFGYHPCENMTLKDAAAAHSVGGGIGFPDHVAFEAKNFSEWLKTLMHHDPEKRFETPEMMIEAFSETELN